MVRPYPYRAVTVCGAPFQTLPVRQAMATGLIRVRSPLLAESLLLSFPPATEMFQFAGFAAHGYGFTGATASSGGLPHSDIRGSPGARPSPRLFAACHVLHRLSVPRHPPDALLVLRPRPAPSTQDQRSDDRGQMSDHQPAGLSLRPSGTVAQTARPCRCSRTGSTHTHAPGPTSPLLRGDGRTCFTVTTRFTISTEQRTEDGRRTRRSVAPVLRHNSRSRRQQTRPETFCRSLFSVPCHLHLVGLGRVERPTSRLSGVRSDQLSYRPKVRDQRTDDRGQTRRSGVSQAAEVRGPSSDLCLLSSDLEGMRGRRPRAACRSCQASCPMPNAGAFRHLTSVL